MKRGAELADIEEHRLAVFAEGGRWMFGEMRVAALWGAGWDHVSVSFPDRTPTWEEMANVKRMFFGPEETAIQIHPPESDYVNIAPYHLHLWRKQGAEIERPPAWACLARVWGLNPAEMDQLQRYAGALPEMATITEALDSLSEPTFDDERVRYVEVQIDRDDYHAIRAALAAFHKKIETKETASE